MSPRAGFSRWRPLLAVAILGLGACFFAPPASRAAEVFKAEKLAQIDAAIQGAIDEKRCPGAVFWMERHAASYQKAYGLRAVRPMEESATLETIYDAASLTKMLATTPAILKLLERGKIELDAPVNRYLPEFGGQGKEAITVRQLMTHTSGLRPGLSPSPAWKGRESAIALACAEPLPNAPGTLFRYSDINFILLGEIVRRVSGQPLEVFCREQIFEPLGMTHTGFLPELTADIAPTSLEEGHFLRGTVHDPTSRRMGGVAGHAGLFTCAADVARYARMLLAQGMHGSTRVLAESSIREMTRVQSAPGIEARRGLGVDIASPYAGPRGELFPLGSYGHTGWTGGSVWIDPFSETMVIFLTNRVHPDGKGNVIALWHRLGTLAAEAIEGYDFSTVQGALKPFEKAP